MRYTLCALALLFISIHHIQAQNFDGRRPDIPGKLILDLGSYSLMDRPDDFERKFWASKSAHVSYTREYELLSFVSLNLGLGISTEKLAFRTDNILTSLVDSDFNDSLVFTTPFERLVKGSIQGSPFDSLGHDLRKNKLALTYLEIPLEFRIYPLGTDHQSKWFIGLGGFLGMRIDAHTKVKYRISGVDNWHIDKVQRDFGINKFRYGLMARFGFDSVNLYAKYTMNNLFKDGVQTYSEFSINQFSAGISLNLF